MRRRPEEPTNVRLEYPDGTIVPLEIVFDHVADGVVMYRATATATVPRGKPLHLLADRMPARTGIILALDDDHPDEVRWRIGGDDGTTGPLP